MTEWPHRRPPSRFKISFGGWSRRSCRAWLPPQPRKRWPGNEYGEYCGIGSYTPAILYFGPRWWDPKLRQDRAPKGGCLPNDVDPLARSPLEKSAANSVSILPDDPPRPLSEIVSTYDVGSADTGGRPLSPRPNARLTQLRVWPIQEARGGGDKAARKATAPPDLPAGP